MKCPSDVIRFCLLLGCVLSGCRAAVHTPEARPLLLGVSPSMETLARGLIDAYHATYPLETPFQTTAASADEIQTALDQNQVSAALQWDIPGSKDWAAAVGWTGIVIAVNVQNEVSNFTPDQARNIFLGLTDRWESVGGAPGDIHRLTYEPDQDIGNLFQDVVLHQEEMAGTSLVVPAPYAMIGELQKDKYSIGYLPGFELSRAVRPVTIDHVTADYPNLISSKYPFRVPVFLISRNPVPPEVSRFAGWAQSASGQVVFLTLQSWE